MEEGTYLLDTDVEIAVQVNLDGVCMIGNGHLTHDLNGFYLTGADGKLDYRQSPVYSHTLYSDYYWYEIGDVIGIGDNEFSYFCFPKENVSVSKARLATEELYKMEKERKIAFFAEHTLLDENKYANLYAKCISNMKPDLVIYRHGKKENKETINFFKEIKIINPAIDIIMLADNISLIFAEQLYSIGVYNLFIGKQIEVMKVIERIIENQKRINSIKENSIKKNKC